MDLKLIRNLVRIMERGELSKLEIEDEKEGLRVSLRRGGEANQSGPIVMLPGGSAVPYSGQAPAQAEEADDAKPAEGRPKDIREIASPMVGTFYRSSSPGADLFTDKGQFVEEDTVVCIIEAMKVMNEIKAEVDGEIVDVLVENGEPVEFGQPLFLVKTF